GNPPWSNKRARPAGTVPAGRARLAAAASRALAVEVHHQTDVLGLALRPQHRQRLRPERAPEAPLKHPATPTPLPPPPSPPPSASSRSISSWVRTRPDSSQVRPGRPVRLKTPYCSASTQTRKCLFRSYQGNSSSSFTVSHVALW